METDSLAAVSIPTEINMVEQTTSGLSYEVGVLDRTKQQWFQGDWDSLVDLQIEQIEAHPARAKLSVVVGGAWLQKGDESRARVFLEHAINWGCDRKLIAQILVAGMHNTLGRVAALAGDEVRIDRHFRAAVTGSGATIERTSLSRRDTELSRLGLFPSLLVAAEHEEPIRYPPEGIRSYAQNFEDVMLWRALWDVKDGFYIDVGAWDPVVDSVSKGFYEKGWRGFHVEPLPEYADKIRQDRPDEQVYQVLLGAREGEKTFYYIPETGLSTGSKEFAERHQKSGWCIEERKYSVMTLSQLFDEVGKREIHWMKIDVEGMEEEVLAGWGEHLARPWVLVIEATEPLSNNLNWINWEPYLIKIGYKFIFFDGINRYYCTRKMAYKFHDLKVPPNFFDHYIKNTY